MLGLKNNADHPGCQYQLVLHAHNSSISLLRLCARAEKGMIVSRFHTVAASMADTPIVVSFLSGMRIWGALS